MAEHGLSKFEFQIIKDVLAFLGGRTQPVMAHLVQSGKLTLQNIKEAEIALRKLQRKSRPGC